MAALFHLDPPAVSEDVRVILETRLKYAIGNPGRAIPLEEFVN